MTNSPSVETVRMDCGVPLGWAQSYPLWPAKVRQFLADARSRGLTQIIVTQERKCVNITALRPTDIYEDAA
jgi:hypothetical protein